MARFKHYDLNQTKMIPLSYADQALDGSFEHALNEIVEEHLDLSVFEHRYHNDATGRLAYAPKVILNIVLYGYYRGFVSSRRLAEACCRNVVFMALSADSRPHFTTIASFVSKLEHEISSLTGPESAKMTSSHGVIQGYNGLAVVDGQAQIVVHAEAHGSGYEAHLLAPLIEATRKDFAQLELDQDVFAGVKVTADSGFHSNVVVAAVEATGADAYIADREYRKREPAFAEVSRYKARDKKERGLRRMREREARENTESKLFTVKDFIYDEANARCACPAGQKLYRFGKDMLCNGYRVAKCKAPLTACRGCPFQYLHAPSIIGTSTVCPNY